MIFIEEGEFWVKTVVLMQSIRTELTMSCLKPKTLSTELYKHYLWYPLSELLELLDNVDIIPKNVRIILENILAANCLQTDIKINSVNIQN